MKINFDQARKRAESTFKKEERAREGAKAASEYEANMRAVRERTARLRAQDGLNTFDRLTFNHPGMNTTAGVVAEIGGEQASGNRVLRIRHNRKCYRRQHSLDQTEIVLAKTLWAIGRERKADPAVPMNAGRALGVASNC